MDPYEKLANAIVIQAAKDYRTAERKLKRNPRNQFKFGCIKRRNIVAYDFHRKSFLLFLCGRSGFISGAYPSATSVCAVLSHDFHLRRTRKKDGSHRPKIFQGLIPRLNPGFCTRSPRPLSEVKSAEILNAPMLHTVKQITILC